MTNKIFLSVWSLLIPHAGFLHISHLVTLLARLPFLDNDTLDSLKISLIIYHTLSNRDDSLSSGELLILNHSFHQLAI